MSYYEIIAEHFQGTMETISMAVDDLADPLDRGSEFITRALLEDRKIVACGVGVDAALAQLFCGYLLTRFEQDRPALPALALGADPAGVTAIAQSEGVDEVFSRQLRALGQADDVLLCIASEPDVATIARAVEAAHERNMHVIALSNSDSAELSSLIHAEDVELRVHSHRRSHVVEIHTMVIHCLCALVDQRLFGTYQD